MYLTIYLKKTKKQDYQIALNNATQLTVQRYQNWIFDYMFSKNAVRLWYFSIIFGDKMQKKFCNA
jgi:hypothetical protein